MTFWRHLRFVQKGIENLYNALNFIDFWHHCGSGSQQKESIPEIHQPMVVYNALNSLQPDNKE
jgi:hypothetical protein